MDAYIPLISTSSTGPLGVVHLPRLWLKLLLADKGMLEEGYRAGEGGFDGLLLDTLGVAVKDIRAFVAESRPDYLAFEDWVKENARPESLTESAIKAFNQKVLSFLKPEPMRSEQLAALALPEDDTTWTGTDLNDLEDWWSFHRALLAE